MELVAPWLLIPFGLLLVLGIPVAFSLGLACTIFLLFSGWGRPSSMLVTEMFTAVNQFALLALPMFVLTGELLNRCDITEKLVEVARLMVGWIKGGLAHVNIVTSMFFAGISGSVLADAASLGPILIPAMVRERYPAAFSAAVTAASAVIGAIIPPSTVAIIIGGQLQISIGGLFAGGIIPGVLIGFALMFTAFIISWRRGYGDMHPFEGIVPVIKGTGSAAPALLIPFIILGGILGGVFTPTEAGAVAVLYTLIIGTLYYRTLDMKNLLEAMVQTAKVTASALIIVSTAIVFSRILTFYRVPQEILELLLAVSDNRIIMALILIGFFLIMGTFMDALANMIILGPLLMPVATSQLGLGMTDIQFGLFLMIGLLLGLITPPLGLLLFITGPIAKVSLERVSLAVLPFLFAEIVILIAIVFIEPITMAIPRALGLGG
jgi:tripartite ATP-independent transporter DctM subunit